MKLNLLPMFILIAAVLAADNEFGHSRWRYNSRSLDTTRFDVGVPITFDMVSTSGRTDWVLPADCSGPNNESSVTITCNKAGLKKFGVYTDSDTATTDTFYLNLHTSYACYEWYLSFAPSLIKAGSSASVKIWVMDYAMMCANQKQPIEPECHNNATLPSTSSKQLTMMLARLGEAPKLEIRDPFTGLLTIIESKYINDGYWTATLTHGSSAVVTAYGQGISVLNCAIGNSTVMNGGEKYPETAFLGSSVAVSSNPTIHIRRHVCNLHTAITKHENGTRKVAFTQSLFINDDFTVFEVPSSAIGGSWIADVALSNGIVVILAGNGLIYVGDAKNGFRASTGTTGATNIGVIGSCSPLKREDGSDSLLNSQLYAWSADNVWISIDSGLSFTTLSSIGGYIETVTVLPGYNYPVSISSVNSTKTISIYRDSKWESTTVFKVDAACDMQTTVSGTGSILIHCGGTLYLCQGGGYLVQKIVFESRDPNRPATGLKSDEVVSRITTSMCGHVAVLTSFNRLFVGSELGLEMQEVQGGIAATSQVDIIYDSQCQLHISTPTFTTRVVPVINEISSPRVPASKTISTCQYAGFFTKMPSAVYLDYGESTSGSATVATYSTSSSIGYSIANSEVCAVDLVSQSESAAILADGPAKLRQSIYLLRDRGYVEGYSLGYTSRIKKYTGEGAARFQPDGYTLPCQNSQLVTNIRVGCPPMRHMVAVNKPNSCAAVMEGGDRAILNADGANPFKYDYATLGCPFRVLHGNFWRPRLDIFDDRKQLRIMNADYIVREVNGRTDYSYNATDEDARCRSKSQSWSEMGNSWGPSNYRSCYHEQVDRPASPETPHQVLNGTGIAALAFALGQGIFVFEARVVDPRYSYCDLRVKFAVDVFGGPLESYIVWGIIGGSAGATILLLAVSYWNYRRRLLAPSHLD